MRFCSSVMVLMPPLYAAGAPRTRYVPLRDTARERSHRRAAAPLAHAVERHRHHDEHADERALPERADAEQGEAVADDLDEGGADDGAEDRAVASRQVG